MREFISLRIFENIRMFVFVIADMYSNRIIKSRIYMQLQQVCTIAILNRYIAHCIAIYGILRCPRTGF